MFVSILQRFGFKAPRLAEQPLQSRASQSSRPDAPTMDGAGVHPEAASQRRQAVKAKPATISKPASKAKSASKLTGKMSAKLSSKVSVKTSVKAPAKPLKTVKSGGKAVVPAKAKVPEKAASKTAAKVALKTSAKSAPKATSLVKKPLVKAVSKPIPKKQAVKAATKASPKTPIKIVTNGAPKSTPKVSAKSISKAVALTKIVASAVKTAPPIPTVKTGKKAEKMATLIAPVVAVAAAKPATQANGLPPPPPLKPGRRSSSRALAHMPPPAPMVPTHAPDAAKASYSTMTERVIAPPPHVAEKKDPKLANNWKTKTAETLTEEEVKAMPDAEYMNDMQMAFFRHKLSILKQDIHNSAGATTEHLREDTTVVPDPADRATIEEEHALELRTRDRERKLLKKIEQSIGRIDSGDYGYCDETGEPIGVGRLIARPTASLSLEAQQRRELKQKMFGD